MGIHMGSATSQSDVPTWRLLQNNKDNGRAIYLAMDNIAKRCPYEEGKTGDIDERKTGERYRRQVSLPAINL